MNLRPMVYFIVFCVVRSAEVMLVVSGNAHDLSKRHAGMSTEVAAFADSLAGECRLTVGLKPQIFSEFDCIV